MAVGVADWQTTLFFFLTSLLKTKRSRSRQIPGNFVNTAASGTRWRGGVKVIAYRPVFFHSHLRFLSPLHFLSLARFIFVFPSSSIFLLSLINEFFQYSFIFLSLSLSKYLSFTIFLSDLFMSSELLSLLFPLPRFSYTSLVFVFLFFFVLSHPLYFFNFLPSVYSFPLASLVLHFP